MIIAIDGTLASGKGTIARRLSALFGWPHMDTGRLYRAVAVASLRQGIDLDDPEAVAHIPGLLDLDDFDEDSLRSGEAAQAASIVAAIPQVRAALLDLQRAFARHNKGAILDGRDIGTVVLPEADIKLWIDARIDVRAKRRWQELQAMGDTLTLTDMITELEARDARDSQRSTAPMKRAANAVLIDTTDLTIDAAVDKARIIIEEAQARQN